MILVGKGLFMKIIATIHTDFPQKFGLPRQSGLVEGCRGRIVFEKPYGSPDAVKGLEGFDYIWLLWLFDEEQKEVFHATVRPPRMGGNERIGVFATRSPFRPNGIGLSSVKLEKIEQTPDGVQLLVRGVDLRSGTRIIDIKPYLPFCDSHPDARYGFSQQAFSRALQVVLPEELGQKLPADKCSTLKDILAQDPRPAYQNDPNRLYGLSFSGFSVHFTVSEDRLTVVDIQEEI